MAEPPVNVRQILHIVQEQDRRIARLENEIRKLKTVPHSSDQVEEEVKTVERQQPHREFHISPTVVITTIGVIGIIIGLVSFFMYAIANRWIGPMAQISIGIMVGLALFVAGYRLYDKHQNWAVTALGGAIAVELISVGFGVWYYAIINEIFAMILLLAFLAVGIALSLKFDSLLIAYFSIAGGMLAPILSRIYAQPLFTAAFLVLLAGGVLIISNFKNWASLRMASFLSVLGYEFYLFNSFHAAYRSGLSAEASISFLAIYFLIYNISSIVLSVKQDQDISGWDVTLLNLNTFFSAVLLGKIFFAGDEVITARVFGLILLALSFLFLAEMYALKTRYRGHFHLKPVFYSLLSSGVILINVGLVLIFARYDFISMILLALPQWILFSFLSKTADDKKCYTVFSYVFLGISVIWWVYYLVQFPVQVERATYVLLLMLAILTALFVFITKDIGRAVHGFLMIALGYTFVYVITEYLQLVSHLSGQITTTILSGLWLAYTLTLYIKTRGNEHLKPLAVLSLVLLLITLVKIAFLDLTMLRGVVRIIGFIAFGVVLLIGGYLLRK